ncbi:MAG TPA: translocation/assembly module TamB domain-containing protein, partial [Sediminibacterium sp.]|nr:translocation/assembly module TamB domain-containing protein [Sediminibacterium sp.]
SHQLSLSLAVPTGRYDNYNFTGMYLSGQGTNDTLSLDGSISSVQVGDSLRFPNTHLTVKSRLDHSIVTIRTSTENALKEAILAADVYTQKNGAKIQFRPSSFLLNEKKWALEDAGELLLQKNLVQAKNIRFVQGFQEISVENAYPVTGITGNNLVVKLRNVILGDLSAAFFKKPRLDGVTSGNVSLNDLTGHFTAQADMTVEQFRINDDSIGLVNLTAAYDQATGELPFAVHSPNDGYHFDARGKYNLRDTTGQSFETDIQLNNSLVDILHMFLGDIFSDIHGRAKGNLRISGDLNSPDLKGDIDLKNASLKVNYTQVTYTIDSAHIRFTDDGIDFGSFPIQDRYKNTGLVTGKLNEKGFRNLIFDFDLTTNKLLLIDTKATDNQQFYGTAIGSSTLRLKGPESNARMTIEAVATDSSHIYIPNSVSKESGTADFIVFKQYGTELVNSKQKTNFNLTVDLDVTANNKVVIDVILDELTGDVIRATGNGKLKIHAGTIDPLTIRGRYNIEHGSYVFNFQAFVRKPFELLPESGNYIEWSGDPFRADIHIDAQYIAERVSLSELVSNLNLSPTVQGYRGDVYVIAQLRDKLNKPAITFRIDFPQGSPVKSDNEFQQYLTRLEKDQNEILNQVAFLILFNSFQPINGFNNTSGISPYSVTSIGVNTISQVLTRSVNKVVSNLLYKLTGDKGLRFDVGTSVYSSANIISNGNISAGSSTNKLDRTRVDLKFGYAFANNNIIVTVGSDIDF